MVVSTTASGKVVDSMVMAHSSLRVLNLFVVGGKMASEWKLSNCIAQEPFADGCGATEFSNSMDAHKFRRIYATGIQGTVVHVPITLALQALRWSISRLHFPYRHFSMHF